MTKPTYDLVLHKTYFNRGFFNFGVRVPSVLSGSDHVILLDPGRKGEYKATISNRIPFEYLRGTGS